MNRFGLWARIKSWLVRLFPALPQSANSGKLVAIGDNGGVYFGDHTWATIPG